MIATSKEQITQTTRPRMLVIAVAILLVLGAPYLAHSQLVEVPLQRVSHPQAPKKISKNKQARTKADEPLQLPFWDDFSFTQLNLNADTTAGEPLDSLWEKSQNVWVTSGVGVNPPTINVASLDGLDSLGHAYSAVPLQNGVRDILTSRTIDLSTVPADEQTSVYLSFFYQWKGNGEVPDATDYFRVEFLDSDSSWVIVATIGTDAALSDSEFYDTLIQVSGGQFFHNEFRFRFVNFGRQSGKYDNWNLDYIYLDKGRSSDQTAYPDGAFASSVGPWFGELYSMPIVHFKHAPSFGTVQFDIKNMRGELGEPDPYTYKTAGTFTNYAAGVATENSMLLTPVDRPVKPGNPLLGPYERFRATSLPEDNPPTSVVTADADSADLRLDFQLVSSDNPFYTSNDTVSARYTLRNYYAYDDGTAEYSVKLNEPDDRVAYRFDLPAGIEDQLTALDVYVPSYTIAGFQTADFFIMDLINEGPGEIKSSVSQVIRNLPRDSFQRVMLSQPINVSGSFFVGWVGSFASTIFVGLDKNNDTGSRIWVNAFGNWQQNSTVTGSLMIRPVFGDAGPVTGIEDRDIAPAVYPNPSQGVFYLAGKVDQVQIVNTSGQSIPFDASAEDQSTLIKLRAPKPGLYIVLMKKGNSVLSRKIIVTP